MDPRPGQERLSQITSMLNNIANHFFGFAMQPCCRVPVAASFFNVGQRQQNLPQHRPLFLRFGRFSGL
jgi:hypothetical protein